MTKVQLKEEYSTPAPDEAAVVAARGDYMEDSLVGSYDETRESALSGIEGVEDDVPSRERKRKLIEQLLQRGHFGPFEHPRAFFAVEGITRDQMAQITRHRVGVSFDVQSMRYVNFEDGEAEIPNDVEGKTHTIEFDADDAPAVEVSAEHIFKKHYTASFGRYQELLDAGMEREDARKVLPIGTKVNMTFTASLRALMHIFDLRVSGVAQDDTRGFTEQVMEATREWAPITINEYEEHVKGSSLNSP